MPTEEATQMAQKLLAAAEELGLPASVVQTTSSGVFGLSFVVPDVVLDQVIKNEVGDVEVGDPEPEVEEPVKPKKKVGRPKKAVAVEEVTDGE